MLYTQSQLVSYTAYCLKQYGITDPGGGDLVPPHAMRSTWEEKENIQPIQEGQPITITTLDGIAITADITKISKNEVDA